jgi:hypothetical protein
MPKSLIAPKIDLAPLEKESLDEAVNNNILVFDNDAPAGVVTGKLMHYIYMVGEQNNYGPLLWVEVPTVAQIADGVYGEFNSVLAGWTRKYFIDSDKRGKIQRNKRLNPNMDYHQYLMSLNCYNGPDKRYIGLVRYQNKHILCGI